MGTSPREYESRLPITYGGTPERLLGKASGIMSSSIKTDVYGKNILVSKDFGVQISDIRTIQTKWKYLYSKIRELRFGKLLKETSKSSYLPTMKVWQLIGREIKLVNKELKSKSHRIKTVKVTYFASNMIPSYSTQPRSKSVERISNIYIYIYIEDAELIYPTDDYAYIERTDRIPS